MAAFEYTALDQKGRRQKGILEGDAQRQIRTKIREMGLIPLEVTPIAERSSSGLTSHTTYSSIKSADLALFTRQLATLLAAGIPIEEALVSVKEQTEKQRVKKIIAAIHSRVVEGHSLANALSVFPKIFTHLYCATIAAGEQTGHLDKVLLRLADYTEQQQHVKQKVQQALIYPSVMVVISFSIVVFLLIYVMPKIINVFSEADQSIPILTKILLAISHFLSQYFVVLAILLLASMTLIRYLLKKEHLRFRYETILLKLPFIGKLITIRNTAQFARTLGILTAAGVPVLEAMHISTEVISCLPIRKSVAEATSHVREGMTIHRALKQTGYFTPMSVHLIASGETTGQLEAMLERCADYQEQQVIHTIEIGLALFEPALILFMGAIILFIVLAILLPIFSLSITVG